MRIAASLMALLLTSASLAAQATETAFVTTRGNDTISFEQYSRVGPTITGVWVSTLRSVQVHQYVIVLGAAGAPERYDMLFSVPGRPAASRLRSVSISYGPDSATIVSVADSVQTRRIAMSGAYPVLGKSIAPLEVALARLEAAHTDSTTIQVNLPTGPVYTPVAFSVKFLGPDSARVAGAILVRMDRQGHVEGWDAGPDRTRRVASLDVDALVAHFLVTTASQVAADSAAAASRVSITLPASSLRRLIGEYALTEEVRLRVTQHGDTLMMQAGATNPLRLYAESPTKFFPKEVNAEVTFEVDAAGAVTGLTLVQNGVTRRAARVK